MDEYVIGSVASIISNTKIDNVGLKKRKKKLSSRNQSLIPDTNCDSKNVKSTATSFSNIKCNNKNSSKSPDKSTVSAKKESLQKTKKNVDLVNTKISPKKRKKDISPSLTDNEEETDENINEYLLPLDSVPSDSEEDESLEKTINRKKDSGISKEASIKESRENTIFIGNIPINYNKQKVCKLFSKFGKIQNARIRCVPVENINMSKKVAAIKKKFNPKRNSLVAYVKFKSQDSANAALKANGMVIDGHHIRVDLAEQSKDRDNNKAVFVGGLPFDIEDDELWEFFQNCGEINNVRIIRDSQTSLGKGFGYVNFNSTASVELALQLDGQELKKRTINVKRCVKSRNKNKLNSFGKKKSKEITSQLLSRKGKKFKEEKKKSKKEKKEHLGGFQGKTANVKQKKKKKLSKVALRQQKLVKILQAP